MYLSTAVRPTVLNKLHGFRKCEGTACGLFVCVTRQGEALF